MFAYGVVLTFNYLIWYAFTYFHSSPLYVNNILGSFDQYSRNVPLKHPVLGTLSFRASFHSLVADYINVLPRG